MLSVARCGYDNAYGVRLRGAYPPEDPAVLKANEALLTAAGGCTWGELFWELVARSARGAIPAKRYSEEYAAGRKALRRGGSPGYSRGIVTSTRAASGLETRSASAPVSPPCGASSGKAPSRIGPGARWAAACRELGSRPR